MKLPVYIISGFLESGKTKFINEILSDFSFNAGERTLLICCEEGFTEYKIEGLGSNTVFIETILSKSDFNIKNLQWLQRKHRVERIVIEANSMWMISDMLGQFTLEWELAQCFAIFNTKEAISQNRNMRQLFFDKLKNAEVVNFNRYDESLASKEELHKLVRVANRTSMILFEREDGEVERDVIIDPLPYDIDSSEITVENDFFGRWYLDLYENRGDYEGKTITIESIISISPQYPKNHFIFGRPLMQCCPEDMEFVGILAKTTNKIDLSKFYDGQWCKLKGELILDREKEGTVDNPMPILKVRKIVPATKPKDVVATVIF